MSGILLLEPHNDDAALFAAFTAIRERAHVVTVFRSHVQEQRGRGITAAARELESAQAMDVLGCSWEQWEWLDSAPPPWQDIEARLRELTNHYEHVYAPIPYPEGGGHPQHDGVGHAAAAAFGHARVSYYHTYRNGRGRVEGSYRVPFEPAWVLLKLRALACYESQVMEPSTSHHFAEALTEWYA